MDQKIRNTRNKQIFAPTKILLEHVDAGDPRFEMVTFRDEMGSYASDDEYQAFLAGEPKKAPKVALQIPKVEVQSEIFEPEPVKPEESTTSPMEALKASLAKKTRSALIKEAEAAGIKIQKGQSEESIISAICALYR